MKFEKKLIILNGSRGAKGTLGLERNAYGVFATLNLYNLPDLVKSVYVAGLKCGESIQRHNLGPNGRVLSRFQIDDINLDAVHCVVFNSVREEAVLYGSNAAAKLWEGNMMDGLRADRSIAGIKEDAAPPPAKELDSYSPRPDIKNYFFDILPRDKTRLSASVQSDSQNQYISDSGFFAPRPDAGGAEEPDFNDRIALPAVPLPGQVTAAPVIEETAETGSRNNLPQEAEELERGAKELIETAKLNAEYNDLALAEVNYFEKNEASEPSVSYSGIAEVDAEETLNPLDRAVNAKASVKSLKIKPPDAAFTVSPPSRYGAEAASGRTVSGGVFFERIKSQIDGLFADGVRYAPLEELMDDTRWVKVDFDESRFYLVGLIGAKPDYISYGVPADFSLAPPDELGPDCSFLPADPKNPKGKGYWLMFQSAATGEPISMKI
jgi:hypothetical protein